MSFAEEFKDKCAKYKAMDYHGVKKDMTTLIGGLPTYVNMPKNGILAQMKISEDAAQDLYHLGGKGLSTDPKNLYSDKNAHTIYK